MVTWNAVELLEAVEDIADAIWDLSLQHDWPDTSKSVEEGETPPPLTFHVTTKEMGILMC